MPISASTRLLYYKRKDIQQALTNAAEDKEIAVRYNDAFGKRPDILQYPADVLALAQRGATSFHCSEELWINPLQITSNMKRHELDELRKGWDLLLDIDCDEWEYSKIAADLIVQFLRDYHGLKSLTVKFSGNHGFHLAVPFEAFPETVHGQLTKDLFPDGPRKIAAYIGDSIKPHLAQRILAKDGDVSVIAPKVKKSVEEILTAGAFDPFKVLVIDTVLISSRHLYRMPYSLNEKSGRVSIPVDPSQILSFDRASADPEKIKVNAIPFLDRSLATPNEASKLFIQAFDHHTPEIEVKITKEKEFDIPKFALQEELFPPCIKLLLQPMDDGKKRAMFVLTNFLSSVGWDADKIEERLTAWNKTHKEPIREQIITGHLAYHRKRKGNVLPPNCDNAAYYQSLQVCKPDNLCNSRGLRSIKNPVNYSMAKIRWIQRNENDEKDKLAEREIQKDARRREKEREKGKSE